MKPGSEIKTPKDLPREELMKLAAEVKKENPGAKIHFKFTCGYCGARCTFQEPNKLFESGQCYYCGHNTPITRGGFMVAMEFKDEGAMRDSSTLFGSVEEMTPEEVTAALVDTGASSDEVLKTMYSRLDTVVRNMRMKGETPPKRYLDALEQLRPATRKK